MLAKYKNGLHFQNGHVIPELTDIMEYRKARRVQVEPVEGGEMIVNIDGECAPAGGLCADVLPMAARFVLPAPVYAAFSGKKAVAAG